MPNTLSINDIAHDGHPCEAAIEFRRIGIRSFACNEISADALDLAIAYAWISKAVSRTHESKKWLEYDIDPNTWQGIRAIAMKKDFRAYALNVAINGQHVQSYASDLDDIRQSKGFQNACNTVSATLGPTKSAKDLLRVLELTEIAHKIEGPWELSPIFRADNLIVLADFRKIED